MNVVDPVDSPALAPPPPSLSDLLIPLGVHGGLITVWHLCSWPPAHVPSLNIHGTQTHQHEHHTFTPFFFFYFHLSVTK